jgi:ribosomal protein S13
LDSLAWSRKYEVLSISRVVLHSYGFSTEQINSLTDEEMQRVAETLNNAYFIGFEEDVKFEVSVTLAEKGMDNQPEEGEPE